jgi:mono/diheme cytochrome c family protein
MLRYLPFVALLIAPAAAADPAAIDFTREIQPILAEHCYACHGPDEKARKAKLRLDTKDGLAGVVTAGKPADSDLIERILETDAERVMPPKKFNKPLKHEQVAKLKQWVEQGGKWTEHWAFVPPRKPEAGGQKSEIGNTIDHFIRGRLTAEGLKPSPEATKTTWLRRVTFDLTGLPPSPKEVDDYLADTTANAAEKVVDRLLKSPRFGEHMARFWLDYARYGDTHGLHLDNFREMYLYREWVIRAFNENKPYDKFLVEQLAGDLLPNATVDQQVATGFLRCNITTSEGGVIEEECYVRNVVDIVDTFGSVMLGLTAGCARCHDHKYDPFSQKDYYSLFAYFNSIEGSALDGNAARHAPFVPVPTPEQSAKLAELRAKLSAVNERIADEVAKVKYAGDATGTITAAVPRKDVVWIDDALPPGGTPAAAAGFNAAWDFVAKSTHEPAAGEKSVKLTADGLKQVVLTDVSPGLRVGAGDKLFAYVFIDPKHPPKEIMLQWHTSGWLHRAYWGENRIDWGKDRTTERRPQGQLPEAGKWVRLEIAAALVGIKPGSVVTGLAFTQFDGTAFWDKAGIVTATPQGDRRFDTLAEWAASAAADTGVPQAIREIIKLDAVKRTDAQKKQLREFFIENGYKKTRDTFEPLQKERTELAGAIVKLDGEVAVSYVFKERATPRPAFLLKRGEYDQRGEPVGRATPRVLPAKGTPANRLELANWLVSADHPLTARVAVNRFWQQVFGTGLVKTADDFGTQGELPSHPELLDYLAVQFRESGWDVKKLMKAFVLSETYRQSARVTPEKLTKDPQNRLLSRGPRFRLDAEMVRDQALYVGGLLVEKVGGPSVKPPQPAGLWEAVGYTSSNTARFSADAGHEKVHRRSLYTFWKRTSPPPQMTALDAPSREACTVRRERTNTPLQALLLMNETQFVEAARATAERAMKENEGDPVGHLFKLAVGRPITDSERTILKAAHAEYRTAFAKDTAAATKLLALGETKADSKLNATDLAALTMVANTVLNLDEVLTK